MKNKSEKLLSVVVPAHNEQDNIRPLAQTLLRLLGDAGIQHEVVFVNDGSQDLTWTEILHCHEDFPSVRGVRLSRGFGKEAAVYAGLSAAKGDCCVVMDADFQHPPEKIPEMWDLWCKGYEVVEGVKRSRGTESAFHKFTAKSFYHLISQATKTDLSRSSDFKLLDRQVVCVLLNMPERDTFFRALSSWVGFSSIQLEYDVQPRAAGTSNWSYPQLIRYAISNITSFTTAPLYLVNVLGFLMLLASILLGCEALYRYLSGEALEGFTTVILL